MTKKNKTAETDADVVQFINSFVEDDQKRADSFKLIELMKKWSGFEPRMWGPSIIGFGSYHYKYASGREGDAPLIGFSPRKKEFSLYVFAPDDENKRLLDELGKYRISKACIYVKRLNDIDLTTLEKLCKATIKFVTDRYPPR
jgi:hypothetical protein